ncbi:MAG: HDOD domain-containing protein [Planctomycetota bacterium]
MSGRVFGGKEEPSLREVLNGQEPPTFQELTLRVLRILRDPEASLREIADAIDWDPGLVVRVLSTVNSAAFGPAREIQDVAHAASFLGRTQLEQIVLSVAVRDALPSQPAPGFEPRRFWRAAARRAALSRTVAEELHPASAAHSFTIGLLQDMAVPILASTRPKDYGIALQRWHAPESVKSCLTSLEQQTIGLDHATVGEWIGKHWELPKTLVQGIAFHHSSDKTDREVPPAVRLAALVREEECEEGTDALVELARTDYGLRPEWMLEAIREAGENASELL